MYGHGGPDRICGSGGHDSVWGGPGNDRVTAGAGWDVVDGGDELTVLPSGNDTLYGAAGNDTVAGDADPTSYVAPGVGIKGGSSGHVPLRGEAVGADHLRGGPGDDLLRGGPGPDSLFGGAGEGILLGGPGRDILVGGPGHDALIGGRGYGLFFVGEGTDSVQSCELVRVHQPRLGLPGDYMGTPPRIVQVTDLAAATRRLASRVRYGRCWCTTDPPRTYASDQVATTGDPN